MGPVFGRKGGASGGGKSSLTPAESINLHFTGDFHAITSAHNLLSTIIENRLFYRDTDVDPRKVSWKRVIDMNDRSLRQVMVGLRGQGFPRESSFDITPASEIMAVLCMANDRQDLRQRLDRMVLGMSASNEFIFASEMKITGSLMALLKEALMPNLVSSLEGVAAFVHGGPFANIAHGCNSVLATKMALAHSEYAVTEAGFAFDLGAEKFLDIKCRAAGLDPAAIVIVATARALKMHGGVALADLGECDVAAVKAGCANLQAHLDAAANYNRPVVVAINKFHNDHQEELQAILDYCAQAGVACAVADIFANGGAGGTELAHLVVEACKTQNPPFKPLYSLSLGIKEKIESIAKHIYGADGVEFSPLARKKMQQYTDAGFGELPICMAKTQNSISDNGKLIGRPQGFKITIRDFEIANGAGYIVALSGEILRMPALPKVPAAEHIELDAAGNITGL